MEEKGERKQNFWLSLIEEFVTYFVNDSWWLLNHWGIKVPPAFIFVYLFGYALQPAGFSPPTREQTQALSNENAESWTLDPQMLLKVIREECP